MSEDAATATAPQNDPSTDSPTNPADTDSNAAVEETFASFPLDKKIQAAVKSLGFVTPTPIQIASMKPLLAGKDVIGGARTGSGKTAAFGLPLLENVKDGAGKAPRGLILAPTRELAMQVTEALKTFAKNLPVKITTIYGGAPYDAQLRALKNGVTIVVGTPGRVIDHMNRKSLDLSKIEFLVLDEADEMLRMGFIEPVEEVLAQLPEKRQIALFSATMPPPIQRVAEKYLKNPVNIQVEDSGGLHVDHIEQRAIVVAHRDKIDALVRVLGSEPRGTTLIFARTRAGCAEVADELSRRGISADALHGDLNQAARERVLARMRAGRLDIVVATDVAARGIDVESITHVVNLQLPDDAEIYVHRIGRTGRAGRKGVAISFVTDRERHRLKQFQRTLGVRIDGMRVPSDAEIIGAQKERVVDGVKSDIERQMPTLTGAMRWWDEWMSSNREVFAESTAAANAEDANAEGADTEASDDVGGASEAFDELAAARALGAALLARLAATEGIDLSRPPSDRPPHYARDRGPRDDRGGDRGADRGGDRSPRQERAPRPPRGSYDEVELFIPVGKTSGVSPGDIVGALANEAGIPGGLIGRITMLPSKTFVRVEADHAQRVVRDHADIELRGKTVTMSVSAGGGARPQQDDRDERPRKRPHGAREPREHTAHSRGPRPARTESDRADRSARSRSAMGEPGPHGARPPREDAARPSRSGPPPSTRPVRVPAPAQGKPHGKPTPGKAARPPSKPAASQARPAGKPSSKPGKSSAGKTTTGHGGKKPAASGAKAGPKTGGAKGRPAAGKPAAGPPGGMKPPRRKSKLNK